ncbi:MAG: response regulator transcription factor [Leptospirales bacterium]|nr:response regulator transcription factor [Leptospirales bacterium]
MRDLIFLSDPAPMRILIVEDEAVTARGLERKIREILGTRVESVRIESGLTASECYLLDNPVDLLLLDLDLDGQDGIQLLRMAVSASFQTIIVSANTDRAIEVFEYGVLDFVPKPVREERLQKALQRLETGIPGPGRAMTCVAVRNRVDERTELVPLKDIVYFQAADNYIQIHKKDGTEHSHRKTMEALMLVLPRNFVRIHRSYAVNMDYAMALRTTPAGKHELQISANASLPVSRDFYRELKGRF